MKVRRGVLDAVIRDLAVMYYGNVTYFMEFCLVRVFSGLPACSPNKPKTHGLGG